MLCVYSALLNFTRTKHFAFLSFTHMKHAGRHAVSMLRAVGGMVHVLQVCLSLNSALTAPD